MFIKDNKAAVLLIAGGLALAAFGLFRGEFDEVFFKGIVICLECMGVG